MKYAVSGEGWKMESALRVGTDDESGIDFIHTNDRCSDTFALPETQPHCPINPNK